MNDATFSLAHEILPLLGRMKASRWEPVEDEPSIHKSRWENEEEEDMPKSKWEREEENERVDKRSKENSESSKWQRVSDSPKNRLVTKESLAKPLNLLDFVCHHL